MFPGYRNVQQTTPAREGTKTTNYNKPRYETVSIESLSPKSDNAQNAHALTCCPARSPQKVSKPLARNENPVDKIKKSKVTLVRLMTEFTLPERLDFVDQPNASDTSPIGFLAFDAQNKPVREYKEALIQLQTDIDHIESFDKLEIRASRKTLIDVIEEALHRLESSINQRLEQWRNLDAHAVNEKADINPSVRYVLTLSRQTYNT
ncbi:hypothetical protein C0992_001032 [Termitomyces sp. T32_za158]|nr:hypothetical protein C0992_001032 [Termitomyces sp. T32_za158]